MKYLFCVCHCILPDVQIRGHTIGTQRFISGDDLTPSLHTDSLLGCSKEKNFLFTQATSTTILHSNPSAGVTCGNSQGAEGTLWLPSSRMVLEVTLLREAQLNSSSTCKNQDAVIPNSVDTAERLSQIKPQSFAQDIQDQSNISIRVISKFVSFKGGCQWLSNNFLHVEQTGGYEMGKNLYHINISTLSNPYLCKPGASHSPEYPHRVSSWQSVTVWSGDYNRSYVLISFSYSF